MAEFKNKRFVEVASYLVDDPDNHVVVLTDFGYWHNHYEHLEQWCEQHGGVVKGMTVSLPSKQTLTLFTLKWS